MESNYSILTSRYDNLSKEALQTCLTYANREILSRKRDPLLVLTLAYGVYQRLCLADDTVRAIPKWLREEPRPKAPRVSRKQFREMLDAKALNILKETKI